MATNIVAAIQDGTFPDDEKTLSSEIDSSFIPPLLQSIQSARDELSGIVRGISREQAGDVDGWIAQAKKAQKDIARCKEDARQIVQEHERIETLRSTRNEARSKVVLLENEIAFNTALGNEIQLISDVSDALNRVDSAIRQHQFVPAAQTLPSLAATIKSISSHQSRSLLSRVHTDLAGTLQKQLETEIDNHYRIRETEEAIQLQIVDQEETTTTTPCLSLSQIVDCLDLLGALDDAQNHIIKHIELALLPHLHKRSKLKFVSALHDNSGLLLSLTAHLPTPLEALAVIQSVLQYINQTSPRKVLAPLLAHISAQTIPALIDTWLDPAIPIDLEQLKQVEVLQHKVKNFAAWLADSRVKQAADLSTWVDEVSKTWLAKRRMASLDTVRHAFKLATGLPRQVERTERQTMAVEQDHPKTGTTDDDWSENWDDDEKPSSGPRQRPEEVEDDGSDAWGFDADEQESKLSTVAKDVGKSADDEAEAEAWGWGDDEDTSTHLDPPKRSLSLRAKSNGLQGSQPKQEDIVLTENYTITDIPDLILEQINKDIGDLQALNASPSTYFKASATPPSGLQNLPSLVLSMFRAIAPALYPTIIGPSSHLPLSNMNVYNDTLYLAQHLTDSAINPSASLTSDVETLKKFARQVYTAELSQQRQILLDQLDDAQGFAACTRQPNASICELAVSSVVTQLRSLHTQWSTILSTSHLSQSIGSLLNSVMGKVIKDIEDMEDISEPESQRLLSFMESISKLDDLFTATPPFGVLNTPNVKTLSTIVLHVPSYLRFQYLQQILDSSLVDIKYLWSDAGLSLEFNANEVVDLIEALFAESSHRRNAIQEIRSGQ